MGRNLRIPTFLAIPASDSKELFNARALHELFAARSGKEKIDHSIRVYEGRSKNFINSIQSEDDSKCAQVSIFMILILLPILLFVRCFSFIFRVGSCVDRGYLDGSIFKKPKD